MLGSPLRTDRCAIALSSVTLLAGSAMATVTFTTSSLTTRTTAMSTDGSGAGPTLEDTSSGTDAAATASISETPVGFWKATSTSKSLLTSSFIPGGDLSGLTGKGTAMAGVAGLELHPGGAGGTSLATYSATFATNGTDVLHLMGFVASSPAAPGFSSAFVEVLEVGGGPVAGFTATDGMTPFDVMLALPMGSYRIRASAAAMATGSTPMGVFPPLGGDSAFDFAATFSPVPAPGAAAVLGLAGLVMARRRR
ncbi:MAG: hypothetical protein ACKVS8_14475 [Phycisphaerales bacterium]